MFKREVPSQQSCWSRDHKHWFHWNPSALDRGVGAKIPSGIKIGNHACIGANRGVLEDVQPCPMAVSIPIRIANCS